MLKQRTLSRTTFTLGREIEYFTQKELEMQIGQAVEWWPVAILVGRRARLYHA
jgi:hypothetical protein